MNKFQNIQLHQNMIIHIPFNIKNCIFMFVFILLMVYKRYSMNIKKIFIDNFLYTINRLVH